MILIAMQMVTPTIRNIVKITIYTSLTAIQMITLTVFIIFID